MSPAKWNLQQEIEGIPYFASGARYKFGYGSLKQESSIKLPGTAVPLLNLYYQRRKIHQVAGDGRSS